MSGRIWRRGKGSRRSGAGLSPACWPPLRASTSFLALAVSVAYVPTAFADSIAWVGSPTDDWFSLGSWEGHYRVPGVDDFAGINKPGPTIAAGFEATISELGIAATSDGSMTVKGRLETGYVRLGHEYSQTGTLDFSGGSWSNSHDIFVGGVGVGKLDLSNSRATSGGNILLGGGSGNGELTLGNSSSFDNSGKVFVSYLDDDLFNVLNVSGASTFKTKELAVAEGISSIGTVSVDGAGSNLTVSQGMIIGDQGQGFLTIAGGGVVKSLGTTIIGDRNTSTGNLMIDGRISRLETAGTLIVGNEGAATMTVAAAATATSGTVVIGRRAFAQVFVTGADTLWETDNLDLGGDAGDATAAAGYGKIEILSGGVVESSSGRLGMSAVSTGEAVVDGSGSLWKIGSDGLEVGVDGPGKVIVQSGGRVDSERTIIGSNSGSNGIITVSGANSMFKTRDIMVGRKGGAAWNIITGGAVESDDAYVAKEAGAASVTVEGGGSTMTLASTFFVGYETGTQGQVSVAAGGEIRSKAFRLGEFTGSSGTLVVIGADSAVTVSADSAMAGSGTMFVGSGGAGTLAVHDAGSVATDHLYVGDQRTSIGNVYIGGTGSKVNAAKSLVIGGAGRGSVEVAGGASLAATTVFIASSAGSNGVLTIGAPSGQTAVPAGGVSATNIDFGAGDGTIVLNHSETDYGLSADIAGAGRVIAENGVTTLSGHNIYSGGTTISSGILKGKATSFGSGQIANDSRLVVDGAGKLANTITGSGTIEKTGSGNLILAADNSYSGNTTISAGALVGCAKSFGSSDIVNNAQLVLDGGGTFSNVVSGTGSFEKTGSGNLVMTGNSTYTGATEVSSGKLSVNGSLASAVSVRSGATLGGSGTVGGLTVASGGTLSPGNSIGTITSTGDVTFADGSSYVVEIDPSGSSDRLVVGGTVTIGSNVSLVVMPLASHSAYTVGTQYPILTTMGGITGAFTGVDERFAYLLVSVTKSADNGTAYLSFNRVSPEPGLLATETSTENAAHAANAVDAIREDPELYQAALFLQKGETQSAFSQLAGELHPSLAMALINRSQLTRDVILERMRSAFSGADVRSIMSAGAPPGSSGASGEGTVTFWSSGFGSRSRVGADGNGATVDMSGGGMFLGLDGNVAGGIRAGLAGGYGHDTLRQGSASAGTDSYYLAAYASAVNGPASLRVGATHAFQNVETRRAISFSTLQENLTGQYDASTTQVFAEAAWRFDLDRVLLEPYVTISYVNFQTEAFAEQGDVSAVSSASARHDQLYTTIGARLSHDIVLENASGWAMLDIGWRHAYDDQSVMSTLFYAGGDGFSVAGTAMARDVALLNLGLSYDLGPSATLTFRYGAVFGAGVVDQSASAQLGVRF
ncbi:autotransporter domain-containing protein [Agrobacterium pusense]|uniref:autotransporter domain-containing protein n=6 Tax=Bacteria TaxID=2 RepID=UPI00092BF687|nr:autotransporter [Agrobacterium pusense]CAD7059294.1 autotransporter outer membrane beta-barrel domain-containing protein [Rhizobium sp. P007]